MRILRFATRRVPDRLRRSFVGPDPNRQLMSYGASGSALAAQITALERNSSIPASKITGWPRHHCRLRRRTPPGRSDVLVRTSRRSDLFLSRSDRSVRALVLRRLMTQPV